MDRVSFYQRMILRKLGEVRESLGDTRYRIYRETVEQTTDFEELRELAELELQIDLLKYTQEIKESLKAQGVTVEDLRREKGEKKPEEALFIEEREPTLAADFRKMQESVDTAKVDIEDIREGLGEEDYDFEDEYAEIEIIDEEELEDFEEDYESIEIEDEEEFEEDYEEIEIEDEENLDGEPEDEYDYIEIIDEDELEEDEEYDIDDIEIEDEENLEEYDIDDIEIIDEEELESEDIEDLGGFKFSGFGNQYSKDEDDFGFDIEDEENLDGEPEYEYDPAEELKKLGEGLGFNERPKEKKTATPIREPIKPVEVVQKKKDTVFNTQTEKGRKNQDMMDLLSKGFKGTAKNIVKASNKLGESAGKLREKPFFKLDSEDDEDDDIPIKFD